MTQMRRVLSAASKSGGGSAALQNASEDQSRNHGHVLECGSVLPL